MTYASPLRESHETFPQPASGELKVWRYISLEKLVAIVSTQTLVFTRVDLLGDDFEGSVTRGTYDAVNRVPELADLFRPYLIELRRNAYASCWHLNDAESEAMWRLYCGGRTGVALQTTYAKLDHSLPADGTYLGQVTYLDYESPEPGVASLKGLTTLMHKRKAFEHEREVRAVIWRHRHLHGSGVAIDKLPAGAGPEILLVPWQIDSAIEHVFVNPYAEAWYRDVVGAVLEKFAPALVDRLAWSNLKGVPLY